MTWYQKTTNPNMPQIIEDYTTTWHSRYMAAWKSQFSIDNILFPTQHRFCSKKFINSTFSFCSHSPQHWNKRKNNATLPPFSISTMLLIHSTKESSTNSTKLNSLFYSNPTESFSMCAFIPSSLSSSNLSGNPPRTFLFLPYYIYSFALIFPNP